MAFHYSPHVTTDGLVLYLDGAKFTSGSTVWGDISRVGTNSSILYNGPVYNASNNLGTVTTDGSNDYIFPPKSLSGFEYGLHWDLNWSIEYWIKPDWSIGPQHYKYLYNGYYGTPWAVQGGFWLGNANTTSSAYLFLGAGGEQSAIQTTAIPNLGSQNNNKWMHLVVVSNGINVKTYYNGILQNTTTTNWATGLGRVNCVEDIKIDSNGKILVGGSFYKYRDEVIGYGLTRLNTNGIRDTNFTPPSFGYKVNSISLSGSTIFPAGWWRYIDPNPSNLNIEGVVSLNDSGTRIDYMKTGFYDQLNIYKAKVHPTNGKLYISSNSSNASYRFNRINSNLTFDTTYSGGIFNDGILSFDFDSNGNIYAGGAFTSYSGLTSQRIVKISQNGVFDSSFNATLGFGGGTIPVREVKVDGSDKIYVGGDFTTYKSVANGRIIKLNTDGTKDNTFNAGAGLNGSCRVINIDNNGKIYAGGDFTTYSGATANRIVRINTDGTRDTTFNIGTGFDGTVKTIAVDSSNKIYVGGNFFNYNGTPTNGIIKLNEDGSIDGTFDYGVGFTRANARPITTTTAAGIGSIGPGVGGYVVGFTKIEIGSFKIYNKALTDQEVGQNFSATRGRYGI